MAALCGARRCLPFLVLATMQHIQAQRVQIMPAMPREMPGAVDSNSPAHWRGGRFYLYNSAGLPVRSEGPDAVTLGRARAVIFDRYDQLYRWIEATWIDVDGTVYAWFHHEPAGVCGDSTLSAPKIGAMVSADGGVTFQDLGIILESGEVPDCEAQNGYFGGGHGDFSVILDRNRQYFYILFSNYGGDLAQQGVAVARMAYEDRRHPAGAVWKYYSGAWEEPGSGGRVTPVFPAVTSWSSADADAFWGPSVHWNTHLQQYVALLNHSCCQPGWPQEGIYVTFTPDLANPAAWSQPRKLIDGGGWYPQVIGLGPGESDKVAGSVARLYIAGHSEWELEFSQ